MRTILDYLRAALAVLCLGKKALRENRAATIYGDEMEFEVYHQAQALASGGPRSGITRNLRATRRGWGYMKGNR